MFEGRNGMPFDPFPDSVYPWSGDNLFHFAKQLMRVVNPVDFFQLGDVQNGQDRIPVNCAKGIRLPEEEVEE